MIVDMTPIGALNLNKKVSNKVVPAPSEPIYGGYRRQPRGGLSLWRGSRVPRELQEQDDPTTAAAQSGSAGALRHDPGRRAVRILQREFPPAERRSDPGDLLVGLIQRRGASHQLTSPPGIPAFRRRLSESRSRCSPGRCTRQSGRLPACPAWIGLHINARAPQMSEQCMLDHPRAN